MTPIKPVPNLLQFPKIIPDTPIIRICTEKTDLFGVVSSIFFYYTNGSIMRTIVAYKQFSIVCCLVHQ